MAIDLWSLTTEQAAEFDQGVELFRTGQPCPPLRVAPYLRAGWKRARREIDIQPVNHARRTYQCTLSTQSWEWILKQCAVSKCAPGRLLDRLIIDVKQTDWT